MYHHNAHHGRTTSAGGLVMMLIVVAAAAAVAVADPAGISRLMTSEKRNIRGRPVSLTTSLPPTVSVILSRVRSWVVLNGICWRSGLGPQPVRHAQPNSRRNLAVQVSPSNAYTFSCCKVTVPLFANVYNLTIGFLYSAQCKWRNATQ